MQRHRKFTYLAAAAITSLVALPLMGAPPASGAAVAVNVVGESFVPQDLGTVSAGDVITWQNSSVHDVTSAASPAAFTGSGTLSGAVAFPLTVALAPGNYRYFCSIHSDAAAANATPQSPNEMVGQFTVAAVLPPVVTPPATTPPVETPPVDPSPVVTPPVDPSPVVTPPATTAHIDKLSPSRGRVGTEVTIKGTGFGTAGVVKFGSVTATATSSTDTMIVVTVPSGVSSHRHSRKVMVTVTPDGGTESNAAKFRVKGKHRDHHDDDGDDHHDDDGDDNHGDDD